MVVALIFVASFASAVSGVASKVGNQAAVGSATSPAIDKLILINADTDQSIGELTPGYVINTSVIGTTHLNIEAKTFPAVVGSVGWKLDSLAVRTENTPPYAYAGDNGQGNYNSFTLTPGSHSLKVNAYTLSNRNGTAGPEYTINFTVVDGLATVNQSAGGSHEVAPAQMAVTSLVIVNSDTNQDIATIQDGSIIYLDELGTDKITLRADTTNPLPGSVKFNVNGVNYSTENLWPFTIPAGVANDDYRPWSYTLGDDYVITATPFELPRARGEVGTPLVLHLRFASNSTSTSNRAPVLNPIADVNAVSIVAPSSGTSIAIGTPFTYTCSTTQATGSNVYNVIFFAVTNNGNTWTQLGNILNTGTTNPGTVSINATLPATISPGAVELKCLLQVLTGTEYSNPTSSDGYTITATSGSSDTTAPTVPSGLTSGNIQQTSATLSWTASTDNVGVTGYDVSINGGTAVAVTGTSYSATSLAAGTTHNFKVRARDAAGNLSAYATAVNFTTTAATVTTPTVANKYMSRAGVGVYATVQATPTPKITVQWANISGVNINSATIYRRIKGATTWGSAIGTTGSGVNSYQDTGVSVGTAYEYKVVVSHSSGTGTGYIMSGINVPLRTYNGKIVLVVDSTISGALSAEISQLESDYLADGWIPVTISVSRTATAPAVRSAIQAVYNTDPTNVKAVMLFGHITVPYSGTNVAPDGHSGHAGAWPADGYYGDMDGSWTQGGGNVWSGFATGDRNAMPDSTSKFSNNTFPSAIELQVGRVDMYNMPAFAQNETQLLASYLTKLHTYKVAGWVPMQRSLVVDQLYWYNFARASMSTMSSAVGPANMTLIEDIYGADSGQPDYTSQANSPQGYLWGHGTGYGNIDGSQTVGSTAGLAGSNVNTVFNLLMGSYYGDWDMKNDFLRAFLATPGRSLTSFYSGYWLFYGHQMSLGENMGYSVRETMNNSSSNYSPTLGDCCGSGGQNVYVGLMGDPAVRQTYVVPASNLQLSNSGGKFNFTWSASSEAVDGYNVYEITSNNIVKINTSLITSTNYLSTVDYVTGKKYMVRAVKTTTSPSGSYENLSLGAQKSN